MCGAMTAVTLSLASVYLSFDLGALWFFYVGLVCNLEALDQEARQRRGEREVDSEWAEVEESVA
jgi:hypothetical protein